MSHQHQHRPVTASQSPPTISKQCRESVLYMRLGRLWFALTQKSGGLKLSGKLRAICINIVQFFALGLWTFAMLLKHSLDHWLRLQRCLRIRSGWGPMPLYLHPVGRTLQFQLLQGGSYTEGDILPYLAHKERFTSDCLSAVSMLCAMLVLH